MTAQATKTKEFVDTMRRLLESYYDWFFDEDGQCIPSHIKATINATSAAQSAGEWDGEELPDDVTPRCGTIAECAETMKSWVWSKSAFQCDLDWAWSVHDALDDVTMTMPAEYRDATH